MEKGTPISLDLIEINESAWDCKDDFDSVQKSLEKKIGILDNTNCTWMFHSVTKSSDEWTEPEYSITADSFEKLIKEYIDRGYVFRSVKEIMIQNDKGVFLTFDDGYKGVFDYVYPICKRQGIPFCVFITTDFIDKTGYMNLTDLLMLKSDPLCTVGAHTLSHPKLRYLSDKDNEREIIGVKEELEKMIDGHVDVFAYPYGSVYAVDKRSIENAKRAGYEMAFSTLQTHNIALEEARFFLPRLNMNEKVANRLLA